MGIPNRPFALPDNNVHSNILVDDYPMITNQNQRIQFEKCPWCGAAAMY